MTLNLAWTVVPVSNTLVHFVAFVLRTTPELVVNLDPMNVLVWIAQMVVFVKICLDFQLPNVCVELDGEQWRWVFNDMFPFSGLDPTVLKLPIRVSKHRAETALSAFRCSWDATNADAYPDGKEPIVMSQLVSHSFTFLLISYQSINFLKHVTNNLFTQHDYLQWQKWEQKVFGPIARVRKSG